MSTVTVPGLSLEEQATVDRLTRALIQYASSNRRRDRLYEGKAAARLLGSSIPQKYARAANIIGWPAKAVDALARRCVLVSVDQANLGDDLGVEQLARENDLRVETAAATTSMLLHGLSFLVSSRGDEARREPRGLLHVVSAHDGTGDWNPRTRRLDSFLSVHDRDSAGNVSAFTLYLPDVIVSAVRGDQREWEISRTRGTSEVPVEVLRYQPRPDRKPMGRSRITRPVIGITMAAMRVAIRLEGHSDIYSLPQLLALGASAEDLADEHGRSAITTALGALYGIPDDEELTNPRVTVQQIAAASPAPHIEQLRQYAQLFSGETSIPIGSLGLTDLGNPTSADAYVASREDLIGEAESVMDGITTAVERAVARSLAYRHGYDLAPTEWDLRARWRNAAHISHAAAADAGAKQLGALPWLAETELGPELVGLSESQQQRARTLLDERRATSFVDRLLEATPTQAADTAEGVGGDDGRGDATSAGGVGRSDAGSVT